MHLHHLAFRTGDLEALCRFYVEVFGLREVRDARPRSVWLGLDGPAERRAGATRSVLMIEAREARERPYPAESLELVAFAVTEAERAVIRAKAHALGCFDGETAHTVYLRDPDGRRVGASSYPLEALDEP